MVLTMISDRNAVYLTSEGKKKYESELLRLINEERPAVLEEIEEARAHGDLSENADYDAARNRQGEIESRIAEIEEILSNAIEVQAATSNEIVDLSTKVTLLDLSENTQYVYKIVGAGEARPLENLISYTSPLGAAILNKRAGEVVTVQAPTPYQVKIVKIEL